VDVAGDRSADVEGPVLEVLLVVVELGGGRPRLPSRKAVELLGEPVGMGWRGMEWNVKHAR